MSLAPGTRLGPYEILAPVGAGGMGEVYRARDPRLGRDVAIKVLPTAFSADPERLRRFEQEARAAAALNHPNILNVYDIGQHEGSPYIVEEMLDGETLGHKIAPGPLSVRRAVEYAIQIAHGLEAAHEKGIVHRDLKPENVFIAAGDRVKILDFGLAKLVEPAPAVAAVSNVPTTPPDTVPGIVLGTIGYMAPEQVRGLVADHRADIFAFGAMLYEMLSGQRAFRGATPIDTMTAILKEDPPDLADANRHISPALVRIVDRCVAKSPGARFQSAADLAFALDALSTQSSAAEAIAPAARAGDRTPHGWVLATTAAAAVATAAVAALIYNRPVVVETPVYRTSINAPEGTRDAATPPGGLALSPDGRRLVFSAIGQDNRRLLWIRPVDGTTAQPIPGTEDGAYPFWSPDSRFVAFTGRNLLRRIDVSGGPPVTIADAPGGLDGTWGSDNVILFFARISATNRAIWRVPAAGGTPTAATTLDESAFDNRHVAPFFLPDGRHFLYLAVGSKTGGANDPRAVYVASLDGTEPPKLLLQGGSNAKFGGGYFWFMRSTTLMAQRFDPNRLELQGEAVPVAQDLALGGQTAQIGSYSVSDNGVLAYVTTTPVDTSELAWFNRAGNRMSTLGDPADYGDVELAPDGTRAAVTVEDPTRRSRDVWVYDVRRSLRTRFTFDAVTEIAPVWSPDGSRIALSSNRNGLYLDLFEKPSSGAGAEAVTLTDGSSKVVSSWSHDGRFILYSGGFTPQTGNLWLIPTTGERKPSPFSPSAFNTLAGRFSPDDRWVAYVSDESGRPEVYVAPFPGAAGKWQISRTGGTWPRWRGDGKEIFYLAPNNTLMAAAVNGQGPAFEVGMVTPLFPTRARIDQRRPYDVSADGQRFLINSLSETASAPPVAITLVVNWPALLPQ